MTIGETIFCQLGGGKFVAMTGASNFVRGNNYLMMKLPKNHSKANRLKITLNGNDLYDMEFIKYRAPGIRIKDGKIIDVKEIKDVVAKFEDVFCDQLQELFTETTWMYTHF